MGQREQITKNLDLNKTASIVGMKFRTLSTNYSIQEPWDSGTFFRVSSATFAPVITLPDCAASNGQFWHFYNINDAAMILKAPSNTIRSEVCLNATHYVNAIKFSATSVNYAVYAGVYSTGTEFMVFSPDVANLKSHVQLTPAP